MWRSYAPHVEEFANECAKAENVESMEKFTVTDQTESGSGGSVKVIMDSGLLAWVKLKGGPDDFALVARERLAFVLGNRLKLPIAPIQITRQTTGHSRKLPELTVLSFATLSAGNKWMKLNPKPTAEEIAPLKASFSALRAFHAWICELDHRGEGWNFDGQRNPDGTLEMSSYDYGESLTHRWHPPGPAPTMDWTNFSGVYANPDFGTMTEIVNQIQGFTLEELEAIVAEIPADCMPQADCVALALGLYGRGKQLKTLLNLAEAP
jgi:hypothetical protein